jgi:RHS repeat-associated protein
MYYQNTWKDQLTKIEYYVNGSLNYYQTFTYDASGNVISLVDSRTSYANKSYQWDGRQLSYYSAYCNSISFKYNDQGIRTRKIQGTCSGNVTTDYTLDGDKVLVESRSNGITLYFTYDVDGTLLSMNYNGAEYFYITNLQGDIIELIDINGNSVVKYKYDAWGNIINQTGGSLANINPYRYRGYRFDVETGLYYLQSRYYDPAFGRFISSDGLLGETGNLTTHNMYAYCGNNPVMYSDITGYAPQWWEDYKEWFISGYESIITELNKEFMIDISYSFMVFKVGVSIIVNLEDQYLEFYPHFGGSVGISSGPSFSFGVVDNYENPGDYKKYFFYGEAGYFIGGGHCFTPNNYEDGARAYYIEIGSPNVSIGLDYYLWSDWMVYDWSGRN